ncbi:Hypothetical predicted protein [Paramuricea clavata]|uniref:Uncharacterized protein n=1 Tax=Paramuricea clavata TaxID=317549 RepID=A0A6S7JHQ2_PARCT|nr:Hypothetical predicted protein [Paramuricea clavata]
MATTEKQNHSEEHGIWDNFIKNPLDGSTPMCRKCQEVTGFFFHSLYDIQHGFHCNRSCVTQLLNVFLGRALDSGNEIDLLYLDFPKAFDSVSHGKLLFKLKSFGISSQLLNWLTDYLHNRKKRVVIKGVSSSFLNVLNLVCHKVVS